MNINMINAETKKTTKMVAKFINHEGMTIPRNKMKITCPEICNLASIDLGLNEHANGLVLLKSRTNGNIVVIDSYEDAIHINIPDVCHMMKYYASGTGITQAYFLWYDDSKWEYIKEPDAYHTFRCRDNMGAVIGFNSYVHPNNDECIIYTFVGVTDWCDKGMDVEFSKQEFKRVDGVEAMFMATQDAEFKLGDFNAHVTLAGRKGTVHFHSTFDTITSFNDYTPDGYIMNVGYSVYKDKYYHISAPNWEEDMRPDHKHTYKIIRPIRKPKKHPSVELMNGMVKIPVLEIFGKKYYGAFYHNGVYDWSTSYVADTVIHEYIMGVFGISKVPDEFKKKIGTTKHGDVYRLYGVERAYDMFYCDVKPNIARKIGMHTVEYHINQTDPSICSELELKIDNLLETSLSISSLLEEMPDDFSIFLEDSKSVGNCDEGTFGFTIATFGKVVLDAGVLTAKDIRSKEHELMLMERGGDFNIKYFKNAFRFALKRYNKERA